MTYGFRPDNWFTFEQELRAQGIAIADIERVELRPVETGAEGAGPGTIVTVTLRSGRVATWSRQPAA